MKVLINAATATAATKIKFQLRNEHFHTNTIPAVKTTGLGSGDSVRIFEEINGAWQLGYTLDTDTLSTAIRSVGTYSVDIIMATAGPASVILDSAYE
jgi:hypothetical protein